MEIQNVVNYCLECEKMKPILEKREQKISLMANEIGNIRKSCARCRTLDGKGIYKADAIITALELNKKTRIKNKNVGKKPIREKQYGRTIRKLREKGSTIKEIADTIGISPTTVGKILKKDRS